MTALRVAYLINQYPKVSHSFIRREILALERAGIEVERIAVRGWDAELVDPLDLSERAKTRYVLEGGPGPIARAMAEVSARSPQRFARALALAQRMGMRADRSLPYHYIYLGEACLALKWMRESGCSHLHAHFGTNSAEVAMLVSVLGGPPYSFTVHGPEEFDKPEFLGIGEKIRRSAFTVAISSFGRSQLYRWVDHAHWPKIQVVRCGLEPEFEERDPTPLPDRPRLVCVGRLCEQKGQLLLVEACRRLALRGVEFELVLAGDGEMRPEIERLVERSGLGSKVRITGWISSEQVRRELIGARALVLPSFAEGLPVAIMEAMLLRRPVLTTRIAGIPELVVPGENGWLFTPGAIDELVDAMQACLATPVDELSRMGERAHRRVKRMHSIDTEAAKLAELFRRAASGRPIDEATVATPPGAAHGESGVDG